MMMKANQHIISFILILVFISFPGFEKSAKAQNTDSLFQSARQLAFNGKHEQARLLCRQILQHKPHYSDVQVLLGRTFTWDHQYDSARVELNKVLADKPGYYDATNALIDLEYWAEKYDACVKQCDLGLQYHPDDTTFLIKKAKALNAAGHAEKAEEILKAILDKQPGNKAAGDLYESIRLSLMKNKITLSYTYDYFQKVLSPWHLVYLQYGRKTSLGTILARVNYASRFNTTGVQVEADAYPKISKTNYGYLNIGYSQASIFPHLRAGTEFYQGLPHAFEASAGFRYLNFTSSNIMIYTAYLGKYLGNYWMSLRTYITPSNNNASVSGIFQARRYFTDADTYIGLRLSYGTSPDDRKKLLNSAAQLRVKSEAVRLEFNKKLYHTWILNIGGIYENEEYYPSLFRYILTGDITLTKKF